ncbi:protein FAM110D [Gastrophryne carolinensis]
MTPINHAVSPLMTRPTGRGTASDRLEADKAKYVKSPQVIHRRQNPAINFHFSPELTRKQNQSLHSSSSPSDYDFTSPFASIKQGLKNPQNDFQCPHQTCGISDPDSPFKPATVLCQTGNLSPSLNRHGNHTETHKDHTLSPSRKQPTSQGFITSNQGSDPQTPTHSLTVNPLCRKRFSGRRMNRPDSLIIYRQKRDVALASKENDNVEAGIVIRFLQGTPLLRRSGRFSQNQPQTCSPNVPASPRLQKSRQEPVPCQTSCSIAPHPQDTPVNEQLTFSAAEAQTFFESCGLEGSLLNLLEMYQQGEDASFGSLESMDRVSGGFAVVEEEDKEERTSVSVIERNARVIKWIYSCQRARTDKHHVDKQIPRESTV